MKTKITAILMAMIFFFSVSVLADNDKEAPKAKAYPDGLLGPPNGWHPIIFDIDNGNIIDYVRPKE